MRRNEKCFCGSGKKYKKCHYGINEESKLADIYKSIVLFDEVCTSMGISHNCKSECSQCCKDFFFISENEFLMIFEWLIRNNKDINVYKQKANESLEIIKKRYPNIVEQLDSYMPKGGRELLSSNYFSDDKKIIDLPPCIFLNSERKCSIYECRPYICRTYGTTLTCEIINNNHIELKEGIELYNATTLIKGKSGSPIIKRPYPIFYWFSFFLNEPYYDSILTKVSKFKDISESKYFEFSSLFR